MDDEQILQVARRVCEQFDLEKLTPERLLWQEQYSRSRLRDRYGNPIGLSVNPQYPIFDNRSLILSPVLQGRLQVDEWGPLLASSAIFFGQLRSKASRRSMVLLASAVLLAPVLALGVLFLIELFFTGPLFSGILPVLTLGATLIITISVLAYATLLRVRRFRLLADRKAAEVFGTEYLLKVLRKIQSLRQSDKLQDPMSEWGWVGHGDAPSIEKRIRNLENTST